MFKKILIGAVVVLVAFLGFVATRPATFKVERSITVSAPADVVFALVADFRKMEAWSPFMAPDPARKDTFDGTPAAVGHSLAWAGGQAGDGKMTILSLNRPEQLTLKLEFFKPFEALNEAVFQFKQAGKDTTVTWTMTGENGFIGKAISVFMNMDKMVGSDFEKGLVTLKNLSESEAKKLAEAKAAQAAAAAAPAAPVVGNTVD
ncbi:SRPBCC family protein [Vitiosangium sp. GDMCC 1.1324]|uniref:SRPBCC family protein n=1 Tax=Vitiosangium sp. (strain GDMCC 1.1324) TaxID=2138576 RepID=UPI000D3DC315|nr:SRPBCC family protein [Vitiosangium sp. GDMCC 1.1324]PTL84867.1 polyketide cyclase [Vitiosangium sp. GDMCC 1.1324]